MKICIVHYHLRTGGVTSVIRVAAGALRDAGHDVCIISGEPPPDQSVLPDGVPVQTVAGLGYAARMGRAELDACIKKTLHTAAEALNGEPDVWHIHNHSLGKGPALPQLVSVLAEKHIPMVLQLHDFAEDGRPANYQRICGWTDGDGNAVAQNLYPHNANIVYAVLSSRDKRLLEQAGLENVTFLPNAVDLAIKPVVSPDGRDNRWLYPTRAIRRKNIGEFILLAAMAKDDARFAISRAPLNPEHVQYYAPWVRFVQDRELPVDFAFGDSWEKDFATMLSSSRGIVTTSVAEGFGLAFLEPWLAGTPLYGRDLPEITADFKQAGIELEPLYSRFDVPLSWVGDELEKRWFAGLKDYYHAYGKPIDDAAFQRAWQSVSDPGCIDFGCLDEPLQRRVIERIADDTACAGSLCPGAAWNQQAISSEQIEHNRNLIRKTYGVPQYRERLNAIYNCITQAVAGQTVFLSMEHILQSFLKPERFRLLRS